MTEADVRKKMMEGFEKIRPKVAGMTTLLMDVYQEMLRRKKLQTLMLVSYGRYST